MSSPFNPNITTNVQGSFNIETTGYITGTAQDDPAVRHQLAGGPLAVGEVLPMWGGLAIQALIPASTPASANALGTPVLRSVTNADMVGFSVFDQNHAMISTPQSPVPMAAPGMLVNYYKFGSRARIALAVDPALASLIGQNINSPVSWDYANNRVGAGQAAYPANVTTAAVWSAPNGGTLTFTTTTAHNVAVGSSFTTTGMTPAGYNGTFTAAPGTTGSTLVATGVGANPGAIVTQGTLGAGGGILPVRVLDFQIGNSMVPVYDPIAGFCNWNRSGNAILLQI